jgi:hypothetical protein
MSFLVFLLCMYFLPTIIAVARGHQSSGAIFVLNLILGVTGIFWFIALVWSLSAVWRPPTTIIVQQHSPPGPTITPN